MNKKEQMSCVVQCVDISFFQRKMLKLWKIFKIWYFVAYW